jgi:hypothetical protein
MFTRQKSAHFGVGLKIKPFFCFVKYAKSLHDLGEKLSPKVSILFGVRTFLTTCQKQT